MTDGGMQGWGDVGSAFDDMSFSMSDALTHAAQRLNPREGQRILDLGTGTGTSARNAARFGARVVGVDPAEPLLDAAARLSAHIDPPIEFRVGDAQALPFEDACFDAAISTFGVMFAPDQEAAAAELARVIAPGGRLVLANWIAAEAVTDTFALLTRYQSKYRPTEPGGGASPLAWGDPDHVGKLLGDSFELVFEEGMNHVHFDSAEAMWEFYLRCFGPLRELHGIASEADRAGMRRDFIDLHDRYAVPAGIRVARPYLIVRGTRLSG